MGFGALPTGRHPLVALITLLALALMSLPYTAGREICASYHEANQMHSRIDESKRSLIVTYTDFALSAVLAALGGFTTVDHDDKQESR